MELVKVGIIVAAGLGSTWAARTVTGALGLPGPATALVQATGQAPAAEDAAPAPAGGAGRESAPASVAVPDMSREEMEEELRRAQAEIAGGAKDTSADEFRPSKPLPADLPIALPSDI